MTRWFDTNNPNIIEGIMTRGDQYAVMLDPIPPPFDRVPWSALVSYDYHRGAIPWIIAYDQPILHPDYSVGDAQSNPSFQRAIIRVEDWLADLCYSQQVAIEVLGVPTIVELPATSLAEKPSDWPVPPEWLLKKVPA
jgi:hypothetical protein